MPSALAMWIYRDGGERRRGSEVRAELVELVCAIEGTGETARRASVEALIAAGELESALRDAGEPGGRAVCEITDALAAASLGASCDPRALCDQLWRIGLPDEITTTVPEGFAYYALHPEAYARAACALWPRAGGVLVVGVRSIGTTLSAITCAALRARGERVSRITVRPTGHAYARRLELEPNDHLAVLRARDEGATVLVVDEGPGISGSTFLATAEALVEAGIPADRITLVCSHEPPIESLAAHDAAARFRRFAVAVVPSEVRSPVGELELSAGAWRSHVYARERQWPASFIQTERRKVLLAGGRLAKFEGLGRVGRVARARASLLADATLVPAPRDEGDGWLSYPWEGRPLRSRDLDVPLLDHLATYCAKRSALCTVSTSREQGLEAMVAKNLDVLESTTAPPALPIERLCVADGRMAPHEWLRTRSGRVLKTDAVDHGDDHFFPGPTDIAWDLAGAIVEWELGAHATERLLATYQRVSGDDVRPRLDAWIVAYATFRLAFTYVGMRAADATPEHARLASDAERYRPFVAA